MTINKIKNERPQILNIAVWDCLENFESLKQVSSI